MIISDKVKKGITHVLVAEIYHFIAAILAGVLIYLLFGQLTLSFLTFMISFFVDVDHVLDYLFAEGFKVDVISFFSGAFFGKWKKIVLPFHAWEYVLILLILFWVWGNPLFAAIAVALFSHYSVDFLTNKVTKPAYFLLYRISVGFDIKKISACS